MEYRKLGKTSSQRKALLRNQVTALILNEKIVTTQARAEEVQKIAERLITLAIKEKKEADEITPPEPTKEEALLTEIRDILKEKK